VAVRDGSARVIVRGVSIDDLLAHDAGLDHGRPTPSDLLERTEGAE
jgi:hypothetical protein